MLAFVDRRASWRCTCASYGAFLSVLGLPALYAVAAHEEHRRRAWWAMVASCVGLLVAASVSLLDTDGRLRLPDRS